MPSQEPAHGVEEDPDAVESEEDDEDIVRGCILVD